MNRSKVVKYPMYPITFAYVNGIFFGLNFKLPTFFVLCFLVFTSAIFFWLHQKQLKNPFKSFYTLYNFLVIYLVFASIGYLSYYFHNQKIVVPDLSQTEFTVEAVEVLKSNSYSHRVYAKLLNNKGNTKVLLTFPNSEPKPEEGCVYKVIGVIKEVAEPQNLFGFNYKEYLAHKRIHYQIHSYHKVFKVDERKTFLIYIHHLRSSLIERFSKLNYNTKTKGFIEALLFGSKMNLDEELQSQFKELGILHVLAVSGMHVVILFATLRYILGIFRSSNRITNTILVIFLVLFVFLAGFSGSVLRAALMCLMAMLAMVSNSRKYTINLIVSSMLLILIVEPNYLFDVGFQLSYLAVFSIVFCYPIIQPFFKVKNVIANYFTEIIGVSIAAQVGVLPLSIYYFKQILLLFLIGNIIAIPLTSFLLTGWFVQLLLSFLSIRFAQLFTPILDFVAKLCFNGIETVSSFFVIKSYELHLNLLQTIILTCAIYCIFWYFYKKTINKMIYVLTLFIAFQGVVFYETMQIKRTSDLIIISNREHFVLLNRVGNHLTYFGTKDTILTAVKDYNLYHKIQHVQFDSLPNTFAWNTEKWLLVDSLGVYPKRPFDVVVLYDNPPIHPDRLLKEVQPKQLIFHTNNYSSFVAEWIPYLKKRKIPYHDMRSKGAYCYSSGINCSGVR